MRSLMRACLAAAAQLGAAGSIHLTAQSATAPAQAARPQRTEADANQEGRIEIAVRQKDVSEVTILNT